MSRDQSRPDEDAPATNSPMTATELVDRLTSGMSAEQMRSFAADLTTGGIGSFLDRLDLPPEPMKLPDPPAEPTTYRVRLDVDGAKPPVWRRLEIRGDLTLDRVHDVIQTAMGWTDMHLHAFWPEEARRGRAGAAFLTDFDVEEGEEGTHESEVRLDQVLRAVGDRLSYVYDFGDDWWHTLRVEATRPTAPDEPSAICLAGRRAGPLEDVGGVWTHNELVEALRGGPQAAEMLKEYRGWLPEDYDPAEFSIEQTNTMLALADAGPGDVMALVASLGGAPAMAPALQELIERSHPPVTMELAGLAALAQEEPEGADDADVPDEQTMAEAVRPWQLLLDITSADGIPLTAAGRMKPAVVEHVFTALGLSEKWIGKGNREDLTYPVAVLRESAQQLGLLRKRKDRLLRTPAGRTVDGDPAALWEQIATSLPLGDSDFDRDASVLLLLHVAADFPADRDTFAEIAATLAALGWQAEGSGRLDAMQARYGAAATMNVLRQAGAIVESATDRAATPSGRALARRALFR